MNKLWENHKRTRCIVLCAGRGTRITDKSSGDTPKVMIDLKGKPILYHAIDYWQRFTQDFVFVVGYKKEEVIDYVKTLPLNSSVVEQKELKGIGHAVLCCEKLVQDKFIVVLGDCLCRGGFAFPEDMDQGVGVWETDDERCIRQSYSIETKDDLIERVVEKPKKIINRLCEAKLLLQ